MNSTNISTFLKTISKADTDALRARLLRHLFADNPHCAEPETTTTDATQIRLPISLEN